MDKEKAELFSEHISEVFCPHNNDQDQKLEQGLATKGLATQGLATKGLATQGLATQGLATQGLATQDLATQDLATQGRATQGLATQGLAKQDLATPIQSEEGLKTLILKEIKYKIKMFNQKRHHESTLLLPECKKNHQKKVL
jgi:hypothetical protein